MKSVLATVMAMALAAGTCSMVSAADDKKLTPQPEKMKACNAQAAEKKGDERKAFMSSCLKAGAPAATITQQDRLKVCNKKAGEKKGGERKTFMSECLKGRQEVLAKSWNAGVSSPRLAVHSPRPS